MTSPLTSQNRSAFYSAAVLDLHALDARERTARRFLGDLYKDLSEAVRKCYALLQNPAFFEEFIPDQTLDPVIAEFGLKDVSLIDPTCGSGHFLLGGFRRLLGGTPTLLLFGRHRKPDGGGGGAVRSGRPARYIPIGEQP